MATATPGTLDRIDLRILAALQRNARITNQALSVEVGLSPSPCLNRVRRLETLGYITGYLGLIDISQLARTITVIATVTLSDHAQEDFDAFEREIADVPNLIGCDKVSGGFDYIMRFICPDIATYERITDDIVRRGPAGLRINSHVVLRTSKTFSGYPIDHLVTNDL